MQVTTSEEECFALIDGLLARWRSSPKQYPFNRPDAIIPQVLIPEELRRNKHLLSNWYIAVCNQMKGRVNSIEAFNGNLKIWKKYPWFFEPGEFLWKSKKEILDIYDEFLPIDKKTNERALRINYLHLRQYYDESGLNLIKGMTDYDEALRRIRNKRTKQERLAAGHAGEGLFGFQHKMVSMLVYFYDWEGWFKKRFPYPSPADIHNFRVGIASRSLVITDAKDGVIKDYEKISGPWRNMVMKYLIVRKEDPVDVSDVLWLFSNLMCGNSPLTTTIKKELNGHGMFDQGSLEHVLQDPRRFTQMKHRNALTETCLVCPLIQKCDYAIPSAPYYSVGKIVLRPRIRVEEHINPKLIKEPTYETPESHPTLALTTQ